MSKTLRNLQVARKRITSPGGWCQGVRWLCQGVHKNRWANCALGAIEFSTGVERYSLVESPEVDALVAAIPAAWCGKLARWVTCPTHKVAMYNNANDHKTVLAWFDRAIARQKQVDEMLVVEAAQPELCDA
jgi:hypothetical protein